MSVPARTVYVSNGRAGTMTPIAAATNAPGRPIPVSVAGVGRRHCCQLSHLLAIAGRFGGQRRGSPARRCRPAFPRSRTPATGR
jgi:hypothetical protein